MLSVGIVGAGLRGRLFADALRDQPGVRVAGFAEPAAAAAESARAATNLPVWPSDTAMLEELDPDAVIVATPDFAHREVAVNVTDMGPGVDHGLLITEIICAVERSMEDGQPVSLAGLREELPLA